MVIALLLFLQATNLPPDLMKKHIEDMQVGDIMYAYAGEMNIDASGGCYLNPKGTVNRFASHVVASIRIERKEIGYEVELLDFTYKWEISTNDLKDWIPVKKFTVKK